jgi:type IV pilus assembly protein PilV
MNTLSSKLPRPATQRGMTLIEILVAIVVLSVGLLGLAGLQLKGLQVNQGSVYRWQAAMLAEDIADRIRADRAGALGGNYTVTAGVASGAASGATLAAINDWLTRVQGLPGGTAGITAPAGAAGNQVTITIGWVDTRAQAGAGQTTVASGYGAPASHVLNTEF